MELKNTYKSKIIEKKIDSEIYFASITNFTDITDTLIKQIDKRFIQFYFCLNGTIAFHFSDSYHRILNQNSSFMIFNPKENIPINLSLSSNSKLSVLVVSADKMNALFTSNNLDINLLMKSFDKKIYEENPISSNIKFILSQMENYQLKKEFEKLFLSGKMYELLIHYFSEKETESVNCPFILDEETALKIKKAKDLLIIDKKNPIKINDLAQKVNLSEYKLQEGFKKIYNHTLYGYHLNYKLDYAKDELINTTKKVKKIAQEIGYENPSHFIDAFKKKFNTTPKQFILNLKLKNTL